MEPSGSAGWTTNSAGSGEQGITGGYQSTKASGETLYGYHEPRLSFPRPLPPSSPISASQLKTPHTDSKKVSLQEGQQGVPESGEQSSSDEGSTESSTATAPSAGATSITFPESTVLDPATDGIPSGLQVPKPSASPFIMNAKSPSFTPGIFTTGPSSSSPSDPSSSSNPSASASPNSSRSASSLMTRTGLGNRTASGSSCATSNTSYIGDDVSLGTVGATHGATASAAETAKKADCPMPNAKPHEAKGELGCQEKDRGLNSTERREYHPHPIAPVVAARVFSPFRPSSATASASFSALSKGTNDDISTSPNMNAEPKPTTSSAPDAKPISNTNLLSNDAIEAAIQAATAGSSHSSGSSRPADPRTRSSESSASGSGSGYASERSDHGKGESRGGQDRTSGSDSGRSHGFGGYGSGSDARSVPPRDTRTLLFVGNLPYRVRWQDLKDLFRRAGTVLRADVSLGPDNRSRGYGTVLLATAEDAGRAIDLLNGYEWQTRVLEVRVDRVGGVGNVVPNGPAPGLGMGPMNTGMGMNQYDQMASGGMVARRGMGMSSGINAQPSNVGYSGAGGMFQGQLGPPAMSGIGGSLAGGVQQQNIDLAAQHRSLSQSYGMSPGVGMQNQSQMLQGGFQGQIQSTAGTPSIPSGPPGRTLFVGNLPYHVQWQDLKDLFRRVPSNHPIMQHHLQGGPQPTDPQGLPYPIIPPSLMTFNVLRADVALGPDGRSKGFGTVVFSNVEEADRARRVFSGYDFNGRQLKVHYDRMIGPDSTASAPPPPLSLAQQMMSLGMGPTSTTNVGGIPSTSSSPQLHQPQSHSAWSSMQQSRLSGMVPGSPSPAGLPRQPASPISTGRDSSPRLRHLVQGSPHGLRGLTSSHQSQSPLPHPSYPRSRGQPNPDYSSKEEIDRIQVLRHGWESLEDREDAGRGFGYDCSGDERIDPSSSQEDWMGSWEMERRRDRAKEQQLFQLLHGSRNQQLQNRDRHRHQLGSTSVNYLSSDEPTTAVPTTSSAPVSYAHSPAGTFARTSSASSVGSSGLSSSPSMSFQHRPYGHGNTRPSISTRTSSAASGASIHDSLDNLTRSNDFGMGMVETMLARRMGLNAEGESRPELDGGMGASANISESASTRSLPIGFTGYSSSASAATRLAVRNWIEEQDEEEHIDATVEGSTTSASDSAGSLSRGTSHSSDSYPGSQQGPPSSKRVRTSVVPEAAGSDADISEADGEDGGEDDDEARVWMGSLQTGDDNAPRHSPAPSQSSRPRPVRLGSRRGAKQGHAKTGDKPSGDRQRPGPIELPPPPLVVPIPRVAQGSSSAAQTSGNVLAEGLFQQHHPFGTEEGHDFAQYDYSGVPTVQAGSSGPAEGGEGDGTRKEMDLASQRSAQEQYQQKQQQWLAMQQQQAQLYAAALTPGAQQGLPPMTPSMPPFNLVSASGSAIGHFQARQRQQQQQQAVNNRRCGALAPGTLSLPASQFQMLYPAQGQQPHPRQQPLTPPAYLHPLGSPGSPYLLGPHHPLNLYGAQHQPSYHPQPYGQHPLAQSFADGLSPGMPPPMLSPGHPMMQAMYPLVSPMGPPMGYGPAAMTPGAPLTATGEIPGPHNPYIHGAVGAPVQLGTSVPQETKGYFDQVYTSPNQYGYGHGGSSTSAAGGGEAGAGIEREILKNSSHFGKDDSPEQGEQAYSKGEGASADASSDPRPLFMHTQSVASMEDRKVTGAAPPLLHHAKTDPPASTRR